MNETITINSLITFAVAIMGVWGFVKIIMEIIHAVTARHDREQKWDEMAEGLKTSREDIVQKYDEKIADVEKKIDDNHADTESKLQQIRAEQYMLTTCMLAVLDGLQQLNCNGKVSEAKHELEKYMNTTIHSK